MKSLKKFAYPVLLCTLAAFVLQGADYHEQTPRPATGSVGSPALAVRVDRPRDLATVLSYPTNGNGNLVMEQVDSFGAKRVSNEGGRPTFRAVMNFSPDTTGTDIAYFQGSGVLDVQTLTTTGTVLSGGFTLTDTSNAGGAATTGTIAWNATPDQVRIALEQLPQIGKGAIAVTGSALPAGSVTIKFLGPLAGYHAAMVVNPVNLTGTSPVVVNTHTTSGWNNQQTLTAAAGSAGGTLTLTYVHPSTGQAVTTAAIAYNASAATVVAALNTALLNLTNNAGGQGYCVVTAPIGGGTNGVLQTNPVTLSFAGTLNCDQLALGYDEGNNPSGTMSVGSVNARVVKIKSITICTIATTAAGGLVELKRAAAIPSGGTAKAGQGVANSTYLYFGPYDLLDAASVATAACYTAHPTAATATSYLSIQDVNQQLVATNGTTRLTYNFEGLSGAKLVKVQGINDVLVINAAAALCASGAAFTIEIEYTEEQFSS